MGWSRSADPAIDPQSLGTAVLSPRAFLAYVSHWVIRSFSHWARQRTQDTTHKAQDIQNFTFRSEYLRSTARRKLIFLFASAISASLREASIASESHGQHSSK